MCGIIGYVGRQNVVPVLLEGLSRLAYRGYDSSGISFIQDDELHVLRSVGKLSKLEAVIKGKGYFGQFGIGHTRWATHGGPTEKNAHPHQAGRVSLVHNGIIENFIQLKKFLSEKGRTFKSDTDTEVISHLIDYYCDTGMEILDAVRKAVSDLEGAYALAIISKQDPNRIICVKNGCPLIVGSGDGEYFVASDIPAFLHYTRNVIYMKDKEIILLDREDGISCYDYEGNSISKETERIEWSPVLAEKGGFKHFMAKEIHEQVSAIADTIHDRVSMDTDEVTLPEMDNVPMADIKRVIIVACGTSWHAALVGKFLIEEFACLSVEVDIASEFRYRNPIIGKKDLTVVISQSGETADTLAALKEASSRGAGVISICNVQGSAIARASDGVILTHAGPEIGVASTKAFTTQLAALFLFAVRLGRFKGTLDAEDAKKLIDNLLHIPNMISILLNREDTISAIARRYFKYSDFLFLGRGINYPIALEGALKLKEISYIHAEGYPAGEMKHGPIALIDENMPVVVLAPDDAVYEKVFSNIMEVKARGGKVIALVNDGDTRLIDKVDEIIYLPKTLTCLSPFLQVIPLQLLAYHIAVLRGCDVDQPRNLAKSVTVE